MKSQNKVLLLLSVGVIFNLFPILVSADEKGSETLKTIQKIEKQEQKLNDIQITLASFLNDISQKNSSQNTASFIITSVQTAYEVQILNNLLLELIRDFYH